jgi:hypothetical protein
MVAELLYSGSRRPSRELLTSPGATAANENATALMASVSRWYCHAKSYCCSKSMLHKGGYEQNEPNSSIPTPNAVSEGLKSNLASVTPSR